MSQIQSVVFMRDQYTLAEAKRWLKKHHFKITFKGKGVDKRIKSEWRFRQADPKKFSNYITKKLDNGILLIIGIKYDQNKNDTSAQ